MPAKPYAVESAVQAVLDHLAEGQPKYRAVQTRRVHRRAHCSREIDKSGYIDKLYGGQAR